jgi:ketosteroid isomerase-like protein
LASRSAFTSTGPTPDDRALGTEFSHVFMIRDEQITEIRRYNEARSAKKAITKG